MSNPSGANYKSIADRICEDIRKLQSENAALREKTKSITLSGAQIKCILEQFLGVANDYSDEDAIETEISIGWLDSAQLQNEQPDDPPCESGLYVWCTEYPEEGAIPIWNHDEARKLIGESSE